MVRTVYIQYDQYIDGNLRHFISFAKSHVYLLVGILKVSFGGYEYLFCSIYIFFKLFKYH